VRSKRQQKDNITPPTITPDLTSFNIAAAVSEASAEPVADITPASSSSQSPRKIFGIPSPLKSKNRKPSQQSLATNTSFATAQNEQVNTPAASYFYSSDEETNEGLNFGNDPLARLSREKDTPTEITFSSNPEITTTTSTMPSKSKVTKKSVPMATAVPGTTKSPKDEAHFDVAQNTYGCLKDVWAWGTGVPVVATFLNMSEGVAAKVLDIAIHKTLPAIDQQDVVPNLKKLDDDVITPAISAILGLVMGSISKGDEMVIKPIMTEVVPRVLAPLSMFDDTKKKEEEKKKMSIDHSPTPEVIPALN
jgi:hypothetical protein